MAIIKAENLSYTYIRRDENDKIIAEVNALKNVNLEIEAGQFVAIIGHNGSGKSTFASLINALKIPTEGKLFVAGMDTSDTSKTWDIRRTAGMVFQNPDNQIIASVVEEDVAFGPENIGVPSEEIVERVSKALETVGMTDYATRSPNRLSGGQKQRVAIAGALAMRPDVLVLDESTAMLDPIGRREVMNVIKKLRAEGLTIVLITHYMEEAAEADRIIVFNSGEVVMDGAPAEIFAKKDELESYGLELPPVAEMGHMLSKSGININAGITNAEQLVGEICKSIK